MNGRVILFFLVAFVALCLGWVPEAQAIPAFARKHDTACSMCHAVYPKLTTFGRAFKENGFRMPQGTSSWRETVRTFPGSLRGTLSADGIGSDTETSTFGLLKPISAGSLGSWFSFWVDRSFFANEDDVVDLGSTDAWAQVNDVLRSLRPNLLNVKAGKFELDLPFTQVRSYNLFPYEAYLIQTSFEGFTLGEPSKGFEISGNPGKGLRYSLAVVERVKTAPDRGDDSDSDLYFRLSWTSEQLHRIGFFTYRGRNTLVESNRRKLDNVFRQLGGDFDLRALRGKLNLYGLYLLGRSYDAIPDASPGLNVSGGFVQLDYRIVDWLTLVSRYDLVSWEETAIQATFSTESRQSLVLGAQSWFFDRLKIGFEYRFRFRDQDLSDSGALTFDLVL